MTISNAVIYARLKRGMSLEDAQNLPLNWQRKLTIQKVNEVKKHGLTLSSAAVALDTSAANLSNFLRHHNIEWPSKGVYYKAGHRNPNSVRAKCEAVGVSSAAVFANMYRKGLSVDDAIKLVQSAQERRQQVGKVKHPCPYDLVKRRLTKQEIIDCEKLGLTYLESAKVLKVPYMTLVSRINKMGINWRGKGSNNIGVTKA